MQEVLGSLLRGTVPDLSCNRNPFDTRHKRGYSYRFQPNQAPEPKFITGIDPIEIMHQATPAG